MDDKLKDAQMLSRYLHKESLKLTEENSPYRPYVFHVNAEILEWFLNVVSARGYHLETCVSRALLEWAVRNF